MAFNIFKKKEVQEAVIYDKNLYILAEVQKQGFVNYMEANGIMVKNFSTEVNKLIFSLIREKSPIRLVIIDYGNGGFKSMDAINNIVGLVSTAAMKKTDEEDSNVTVFTKSGALTKALKDNNIICDIREYKGASDVVKALMMSEKTFNRIKLNLFWAFIYNGLGIPIAAGIFSGIGLTLSPELAGLAMAFSSISVMISSLMLNRVKIA